MAKQSKKLWRTDINPFVQQIAKQAVEEYVKSTGYCSELSTSDLPNGFTQRFAELLVKELVTKCQNDWYGDSLDDICDKMLQVIESSDPEVVS